MDMLALWYVGYCHQLLITPINTYLRNNTPHLLALCPSNSPGQMARNSQLVT